LCDQLELYCSIPHQEFESLHIPGTTMIKCMIIVIMKYDIDNDDDDVDNDDVDNDDNDNDGDDNTIY
jgi:hypothetical protein